MTVFKSTGKFIKVIYVKLNDEKHSKLVMQHCNLTRQNHCVPIEKVEASFALRKNKTHSTIRKAQLSLMLSW